MQAMLRCQEGKLKKGMKGKQGAGAGVASWAISSSRRDWPDDDRVAITRCDSGSGSQAKVAESSRSTEGKKGNWRWM